MNTPATIADLIDLDRYPLDRIGSPAWQALIDDCKDQYARQGAANLHGFVRAEAIGPLAEEAKHLLRNGLKKKRLRTAFFHEDEPEYPEGHPRRRQWPDDVLQLAYDQIPDDAMIRTIYEWDPLTEFIRVVEERDTLYRMADEFQALNLTALADGEMQPWHFDANDFTITLLLQASESGGDFNYATELRHDGNPDYNAISRIFDGDMSEVRTLERGAGTLTLFRGRNAFHVVTPCMGKDQRITAIMTYDEKPDCVASERGNTFIYGPRVAEIYRRRREAAQTP